jgi:hypothetical protein
LERKSLKQLWAKEGHMRVQEVAGEVEVVRRLVLVVEVEEVL